MGACVMATVAEGGTTKQPQPDLQLDKTHSFSLQKLLV
jgi:hypothetical protein